MSREGVTFLNVIDRFTRDDASAKVWWPFALILLILFVLTFPGQNRQVLAEREDAADWAAGGIAESVRPRLEGMDLSRPLPGDLDDPIGAGESLLAHPLVESVRIWTPDGRLLFSSNPDDTVGSAEYLNDESIEAAMDSLEARHWVVSTASLSTVPAPATLEVYSSVTGAGGTSGVIEVRIPDRPLLADVRSDWMVRQIALGAAGLLVLLLAIMSMREPVARIGAGVQFYPETLPGHLAVMDKGEEIELRQAGSVARSRVEGVMDRLRESEEMRLALEGKLQNALSQLAVAAPTAARRIRQPQPAPEPEPPVVRLPEPQPEPVALAEPEPEPQPEPVALAEPEPEPQPEPVALAEPEPEPQPEPVALAEPVAEEAVVVLPEAEPAEATEPALSVADEWVLGLEEEARKEGPLEEDLVILPEAQPLAPDHDETAVEVLNRLVEPVGTTVVPEADPGEMRHRLARTAALKKPGSRHEERFLEKGPSAGNGKPGQG